MPMPYPEEPVQPGREQFAESEATFYEQLIEGEVKNIETHLAQVQEKLRLGSPNLGYVHLHTSGLHDAATRLGAYAVLARQLRNPRINRIESERRCPA
jgi:hypothetical protein